MIRKKSKIKRASKKTSRRNPKKLSFEEAQDKLDDLGVKLRDNDEWDCYEVYPMYGLRENDPLHSYTQDRSEESLQEIYKKGLQIAKKLGKFSKISYDLSKETERKKRINPDFQTRVKLISLLRKQVALYENDKLLIGESILYRAFPASHDIFEVRGNRKNYEFTLEDVDKIIKNIIYLKRHREIIGMPK